MTTEPMTEDGAAAAAGARENAAAKETAPSVAGAITRAGPARDNDHPIASMRAACRAAFSSTATQQLPKGGVTVDLAACRSLGAALAADASARRAVRRAPQLSRESPLSLPVRFATLEDEANLLALYHLLDFGSGYDAELRATRPPGRPQREALAFGVLGLHLGGKTLDARWMAEFSAMDVRTAFGIEATVDVPLREDLPGVTVSKPGPLAPLASALRRALNETGRLLLERQEAAAGGSGAGGGDALEAAKHKSLGALVLALLAEGNGLMGGPPTAAAASAEGEKKGAGGGGGGGAEQGGGGGGAPRRPPPPPQQQQQQQQQQTSADFVRELVDAVPAFGDWGLLLFPDQAGGRAERLPFWRRAQNLAADLARLADRQQPPPLPAELAFSDGAARELSAEASPAVAAALRARGLLRYSAALAAAVDAGADLSGGGGAMQPSERAIRAATVAAVDAIVEGGGAGAEASASSPTAPFTAREVSAWLSGQVVAAEDRRERAAARARGESESESQEAGEEGEEGGAAAGGGGGGQGAVDDSLLLKKHVYRETTAY